MPILKIEKLTKKYGKTYALNGLDMEVKKGDIYGFVGPNGAGKTTTLRIISGLLKSDGGDLWLDGVRTTKNILKQKKKDRFGQDQPDMIIKRLKAETKKLEGSKIADYESYKAGKITREAFAGKKALTEARKREILASIDENQLNVTWKHQDIYEKIFSVL